jgi:Mlc titration factor MtfA (ptsG expression regulator)
MGLSRWWQGLQARREGAAVARRAIPDDLWKRTLVRYPFLQRRDPAAATELRRLTSLFLDRKEFSAAGGLRLTDAMVVAIAAQAVLPVLRLGLVRYDGFIGIVVHPDQVTARREVADDDGVVHEYDEMLAGEAVHGGPIMLSWRDVRSAGVAGGSAYNVVIHEFAHVLDFAGGGGLRTALEAEFERFCARVDAGEDTVLDPYGASAVEEFFAVASEAFFVSPDDMRREHPALYERFVAFYGQDPAVERPPPRRGAGA